MNMEPAPRQYNMTARAEAAARTARDILTATIELWRERSLDEITLQAIADRAGVSVQTVIRRFGSKEGIVEATLRGDVGEVRVERDRTTAGDVDAAVDTLLSHYERDGDAVLRTLALEDKMEAARAITAKGREEHRRWCARVFAPFLPAPDAREYDLRLDAFFAATDIYLWKLLRRDFGRTIGETKRTLRSLIDGLARLSSQEDGAVPSYTPKP